MEVSESTKLYLSQVAERAQDYYDAFHTGKQHVLENNITNVHTATSCVLMSILWCASKRNDLLDEQDVCTYLNVDTEVNKGDIATEIIPELAGLPLEEILQYIVNNHGST